MGPKPDSRFCALQCMEDIFTYVTCTLLEASFALNPTSIGLLDPKLWPIELQAAYTHIRTCGLSHQNAPYMGFG